MDHPGVGSRVGEVDRHDGAGWLGIPAAEADGAALFFYQVFCDPETESGADFLS